MNNRIRELITECTEKLSGYDYRRGNYTETLFDKEKFAKLIIEECAALADSCPADYLCQPNKFPSTWIKENFKVDK